MNSRVFACCIVVVVATALGTVWFFKAGVFAHPSPTSPSQEEPAQGANDGDRKPGRREPGQPKESPVGMTPREWARSLTPASAGSPRPSAKTAKDGAYGRAQVDQPKPESPFVPHELLVKFRPEVTVEQRQGINAVFGASEVARLGRLDAFRLQLQSGSDVPTLARAYEESPLVEFAQPNYIYTTSAEPSDPSYASIQHWYHHAINAPAGWDVETGATNVIVAVVDSGTDLTHPDLDDQIWVNLGEIPGNGIDDDGNGCIDDVSGCDFVADTGDPDDDYGHGTFVSGVACAETNNAVSGAGTAFDCTIMPVKVLDFEGFGTSVEVADGILYAAENGADIINLSLGIPFDGLTCPTGALEAAALAVAHDTFGATIVAAAGNDGVGCVGFPGSDPNTIAVGASGFLDAPDARAYFSQWGPEIDVAAPGMGIVSAVPPELCGIVWPCLDDGLTSFGDGTSFSTPMVSGLASLLLAQDPTRTNEEVRTIVRSSARDLPDSGTPNWDGDGRIDLGAALGGGSAFANVNLSHTFSPDMEVTVGVGDPAAPLCAALVHDNVPVVVGTIVGAFGVGECASFWPPTNSVPWFLKVVDNVALDSGSIDAWSADSGGVLCAAFDTPVSIPDNDPAGAISFTECLQQPDLALGLSAPAAVVLGDQFTYETLVTNRGTVGASPVIVDDTLPPELSLSGAPPEGCLLSGSTVSCDLGSLGPGDSAAVALTVDTQSAGPTTNCATVDPGNAIPEANETNNTDCADTEIIEVPADTFSFPDPIDDTFGLGLSPPNIIEVHGSFDESTFYLTVEFADEVDPVGAGSGNEVTGYIDFDTDQNPSTGFTSSADYLCPIATGMSGTDDVADLFGVSGNVIPFYGGGTAPIAFSGSSFVALVPLSVLGGDNAFDFNMVLGSSLEPTDCAPNGAVFSCSAGTCVVLEPQPPENDLFADATVIPEPLQKSPPASVSQSTAGATVEPSELQPCGAIGATVWFRHTPTSDGILSADTFGSSFDTALAAYAGETLDALVLENCNDDANGIEMRSRVSFEAIAGTTYFFQVGGVYGSSGNLEFHLRRGGLATRDLTKGLTPSDLAQTLAGEGIAVSNVTFKGLSRAAGVFTGDGTGIIGPEIESGVILSSGDIASAVGPNRWDTVSSVNGTAGDPDLDDLSGFTTYDAAVLEFDFVPAGNRVSFQYVFTSDEYNEFVHSAYNDTFAFFVNGVNCATVNGAPVSINTINNGNPFNTDPRENSELFINNDISDGGGAINTEMDGLTVVLTCVASANAGEANHVKLAIADATDRIWDAKVLLKAGSLVTPVTVRAGSDTVPAGQQVTIPVDALDVPGTPGQGAFTVEVEYDTSLLVGVGCEADPGGIFDMATCNPEFEPGVARCTGASASGVSGAELRLCDLTFQADAGASPGTSTPLVVDCLVKTDPTGDPFSCNGENGKITIGLQGDVNCDGEVNVVDALYILQYEVGRRADSGGCPLPQEPPPALMGWLFAGAGDVNKDQDTNVVDAMFILQCEVNLKPGANMPFCTDGEP